MLVYYLILILLNSPTYAGFFGSIWRKKADPSSCVRVLQPSLASQGPEFVSDAENFAPALPIDFELPATREVWLHRPYFLRSRIMGYLRGEHLGAALHKDFYFARVTYLGAEERKAYQIFVKDGLFVDINGNRLCPEKCRGIFVMSPTGEIYFSDHPVFGKFHHSSFLAGADVAAAGELKIRNGKLLAVNNRSGHYRPTYAHVFQFLLEIQDLGLNSNYKLEFYDLTGKYVYDYRQQDKDKPLRKASLKKVSERPGWARRHIGPIPWEILVHSELESFDGQSRELRSAPIDPFQEE